MKKEFKIYADTYKVRKKIYELVDSLLESNCHFTSDYSYDWFCDNIIKHNKKYLIVDYNYDIDEKTTYILHTISIVYINKFNQLDSTFLSFEMQRTIFLNKLEKE